jgi:membrane-associated phospholipid phosphatase
VRIPPALRSLRPHDLAVVCFAIVLSFINLVFHRTIPQWYILIGVNIVVALAVMGLAYYHDRHRSPVLSAIHLWYLAPLIFLTFKELYLMIYPIHGRDYDDLFIAIDRWMFGVDPTVWISQFAHPVITEVLQIAYASFYFLFLLIGFEIYRRGDRRLFYYYAFVVVHGFFLSYIGYFFLPAVGPRFTLHDFDALNHELPGLFLTNFLRDFVNVGESIPLNVSNPVEYAQRDVFPSGHTMMMLIMIHVAMLYRLHVRRAILVVGILMIIATVYLRYHYVIDLVAGAGFYGFCMWTAPQLFDWWEGKRNEGPL